MNDRDDRLPDELQEKLNEVEERADAESRTAAAFDTRRGAMIGAICFVLAATFGLWLRSGTGKSLTFGMLCGITAFVCGGFRRGTGR